MEQLFRSRRQQRMGSTLLCSATQPHLRPDDQDSPYCPHPRYRGYWNVPGTALAQGFVEETGSSTEESLTSTTQEAAARFYAHSARPCPCPCSYSYSYSCHQQCSHHQLHEYALPSKGQEEAWQKLIFLPWLSFSTFLISGYDSMWFLCGHPSLVCYVCYQLSAELLC